VTVVAVQVAFGLTLAVAGALFAGSLINVRSTDPGVDLEGVSALELRLLTGAGEGVSATEAIRALSANLLERVRRVPGVEAAALTTSHLFDRSASLAGLEPPPGAGAAAILPGLHAVTPGFREVLRPTMLEGRWFSDTEFSSGADVVLIDETIARAWWPDGSALGQEVQTISDSLTVVGVVAPALFVSWDQPASWAAVYRPAVLRGGNRELTLILRSANPARIARDVIESLREFGTSVRVSRRGPLTELIAESIVTRRLQSLLFGGFATAALVILLTGVFGQVACSAARRNREVGIRLALGATRDGVVRLLVREQIVAVFLGLSGGALVSAWTVRSLSSYLYKLEIYHPGVWVVAIVTVAIASILGALLPSLRASRVDPVMVLRSE
jgi:hypothetical protein